MNKIGSRNLPISIEDDAEGGQTNDINQKLQEARNKSIIEEAQFTSQPLDICFAVVKTLIQGDITAKQRELNKAILQYFKDQVGKNMVMQHFYPRIEPDFSDPNTKINTKQFLLYGVDYLTTNAIRDRFTIWNYQEKRQIDVNRIQWINDSLCKITYSSEKEAEAVLKEQVPMNTKMEDQDGFQKGWLQAKPYTVLFFERPLWIRYSTTDEQILPKQSVNNFIKFIEAKRKLARVLLQKYNGIRKFQQVVTEIQRKKIQSRPRRIHDNGMNNRDRTREKRRNHYQDRVNQNQRSFRDYNNNRRQNERQPSRQIRTVHYEHQPYRQGQDFRRGQGNRNFSRPNVEYLDYKQSNFSQSNINLSFTYKKPQENNKSFNKNNKIQRRNCYDSHQINSQYSFNNFGAERILDQSHHSDYIFNQNSKKDREDLNCSIKYDYQQGRNRMNTSFTRYDNNRGTFHQNLNLSYDNKGLPKENLDLDISIIVPKDIENNKKGGDDFFEYLHSNISSVREINEHDFNNDSFQYEKKPEKNKGKGKKDKQQSIYNQDSY